MYMRGRSKEVGKGGRQRLVEL